MLAPFSPPTNLQPPISKPTQPFVAIPSLTTPPTGTALANPSKVSNVIVVSSQGFLVLITGHG